MTSRPPSRRGVLAAGLWTALAGAGVTSCADSSSGGNDPDGPVTFWSALRGSDTLVAKWNAIHPDDPIAYSPMTSGLAGGNAKISNAARAGNAPDIVTIVDADLPSFAIDGVCADLTDLVTPRLRTQLGPQAWTNGKLDDRVYGIPLDLGPMLLAYRTDILESHRIEVPTTWDEFREAARQLKRQSGIHLTSFHPNAYNVLAGHTMQSGGQWFAIEDDSWVVDFLDSPTRRVADYWQGLIDEDLLLVAPGSSQEWLSAMARGKVAAHLVGPWGLAALASSVPGTSGRWRVAPLPQWDTGQPVLGTDGVSLHAITADSPRKERAMRFLDWMSTSPEAITARLSGGRSSLFPAAEAQVDAASRQFKTDFYDGQDLYDLVTEQARLLRTGWTWGPRMQATATSLHNGLARLSYGTKITEALRTAQAETLPDMRSLGLKVRQS
ncbi:putative arabinose-binding protein precursor [Streptomyces sp. YIM 130001]|uniref:ABC transporter substrate-binding protein n=1 Tax=Streptomyces sp. YIM 130001 TaxID=2259644 RepID=UPI000E65E01C|nr:extracellular solute-binding protein [Streptomyces sp. YIM 130001]RII15951.1 putative arabinose-binding protein precursor [Streptomyces sp. YIM 130001]